MSTSKLAPEALSKWEANATFWDHGIGKDGNRYWRVLQEPSLRRLLGDHLRKPGCRALDLATGNGLCARWLASQGAAEVVATDGSVNMLEVARRYAAEGLGVGIKWRKVDVTSETDLEDLVEVEKSFDVVLMNMAIMDVPTLEPLVQVLPRLLAKAGVFVATVLHPVFFTSGAFRNVEIGYEPETGEQRVILSKIIKDYLFVPPAKGIALDNQPEKQILFHRPMGELFTAFFKGGLVMDGMEELAFTDADRNEKRVEAATNYTKLPSILAWRMHLTSH